MSTLHYLPRIRFEEGGVVRAVVDLCLGLHQAGADVALMTYDPADASAIWDTNGPEIVVIQPPRGLLGLFTRKQKAHIEQISKRFSMLHVHGPWDLANKQMAELFCRQGKQYVLSTHGMLDDWSMLQKKIKKRLYLALAARKLLEAAKYVHCTAEAELQQAQKWFASKNGIVVPLVVDMEPYSQLPGPEIAQHEFGIRDDCGPVLLFLSRLHHKKGIELLIDAVSIILESFDVQVFIAGPGESSYVGTLEQRIKSRGLGRKIRLLGAVSGTRKYSLYQAADVFVLPSYQENFGLVLPESLACGTPVVTTRAVDIWPELSQSGGATILRESTPKELAATLVELLQSGELPAMGQRGKQWVDTYLDSSKVVQQYIDLYEK